MSEKRFRLLPGVVVAGLLVVSVAGPARAAITVINTWNLGNNDPGAVAGGAGASTTVDSTGSITLSKTGTTSYVNTTRAGLGMDFPNPTHAATGGADDYYSNTTATVPVGATNWGFEAIVHIDRVPANNEEQAVVQLGTGNGSAVSLQTFGNGQWAVHFPGVSIVTYSVVDTSKEQHLAFVLNGGTGQFYVDGVLQSGSTTGSLTLNAGAYIGAGTNVTPARGFDGQIGVVRTFQFNAGEFNINDTLVNSTPEPASFGLIALGGMLMVRRRHRTA